MVEPRITASIAQTAKVLKCVIMANIAASFKTVSDDKFSLCFVKVIPPSQQGEVIRAQH
jgi:hypothetical protein